MGTSLLTLVRGNLAGRIVRPMQHSRATRTSANSLIGKIKERVGALRADVIAQGRKARLADALIAQSCLDHSVPLITRDADFRNFARDRELELVLHRARPGSS